MVVVGEAGGGVEACTWHLALGTVAQWGFLAQYEELPRMEKGKSDWRGEAKEK